MNKAERIAAAEEIIRIAAERGCAITLNGEWVEFRPPLPINHTLRASEVSREIAAIIRLGETP